MPSRIFMGKALSLMPTQRWGTLLCSTQAALALIANTRLSLKYVSDTNTLAYFGAELM